MKFRLSAVILGLVAAGVGIYIYSTTTTVNCGTLAENGSSSAPPALYASAGNEVPLPKPTDWVDYGPVLEASPEGAWDFVWTGMASIVKKKGRYYFYYVANDGFRSHDGEAARHRAIGVATSRDGIRFTKYEGNPIMTHSPFNGEEEGANSAGVTLSANGDFVVYYGAAIGPKDKINADGRVAVSQDGYKFRDITLVLDHRPWFARFLPTALQRSRVYGVAHRFLPTLFHGAALYGYGDEIFPVAAFQHQGNWYVYYVPNGGTASRTLGLAHGQNFDALPCSLRVLDASRRQPVWAWSNIIWLAPDKIALFVQRLETPDTFVEVRTASQDAPHQLSEPVERYDIPGLAHGAVFLDAERRTWFMYYNRFDAFWRLKLAPAGEPDTTPPTAPTALSVRPVSHEAVDLSWAAAMDQDTGVVLYHIYRNGIMVGSTKSLTFTDVGTSELTRFTYGVSAVNFHAVEGSTAEIDATTPADTVPPTFVSATSSMNPAQVRVVFSEPVDAMSARDIGSYSINNGVTVKNAALDADLRTVTLTTSLHQENVIYTLTVNRVLDRASTANSIEAESQAIYTYSGIAGLVGYWNFDQGNGSAAPDLSGYRNDGVMHGATGQHSIVNKALDFNGENTYVLVPESASLANVTTGSFTFAAWAKPEDMPSSTNGYGILLRVPGHPGYVFGLSYGADGQYQAQLITMPKWSIMTIATARIAPKAWCQVTMVVDDVAKQFHLYVDGEPVSGSPKSYSGRLLDLNQATGETHGGGEYYIGSTKPDRGAGSFFRRHFKGLIGEARIYGRALSAGEVQSLFALSSQR